MNDKPKRIFQLLLSIPPTSVVITLWALIVGMEFTQSQTNALIMLIGISVACVISIVTLEEEI